jgi:hypothetical protein
MKPVLIVENNTTPLSMNENAEGASKKDYVLGGIFTEFGVKNRNERIYTADKFIPCLDELNERINTMGVVYGEFDHPDVFDTSLSRSSHLIQKAFYVKESNRVDGQIRLLNTYWGKEAKALVDDGCPMFVSSRAAGITEANGTVTLKKLFTYDIVADPGFASARLTSVNESFGYTDNANFRIYEMSDESKINELFNMNKNEFVTKDQLTDYSKYIINEIASTKKEVKSALKTGNLNPKKLEQLLEYYEELNKTNEQVVKYLDYLAEKVQVVVNENKSLKSTTEKLVSHNDYLAENLEKAINYSEYLAESLDNSIAYSEYLAEHVEGNIAYSEYIAEHLDDNIAYSEYIAENLDKTVTYAGMISEKLNGGKVFENSGESFPTLNEAGFELLPEEEEDEYDEEFPLVDEYTSEVGLPGEEEFVEEEGLPSEDLGSELPGEEVLPGQLDNQEDCDECGNEEVGEEERVFGENTEYNGESDSDLSLQIDKLIEEAKKRKVSESNDLNFLKFLNKSQVDSYYELSNEEQEQVKLYINEKSYYSSSDVLKLISEALSVKNESIEEKLVRLMPENIKPIWSQLNEASRKSILSQARLYPELNTESKVEHFWLTRNLKKNESVTKKLVAHESLIQEDRLSDSEVNAIMERFRSI